MKQLEMKPQGSDGAAKTKQTAPSTPPPPPLPPPPRFWAPPKPAANTTISVTKQEIARFWRQKRMQEEEHLLAAVKAAARIRARNLTEEDYKRFEESLKDRNSNTKEGNTKSHSQKDDSKEVLHVGVKDWWTRSKYAYLNQPAIESMDASEPRASSYIPNFCFYKPTTVPQRTSLGVF